MAQLSHTLVIMGFRGIPAAHGGFETFAQQLACHLRDRGWNVTVYCQGSVTGETQVDRWNGITRIHIPVRWHGAMGTVEFDVKCVADVGKRPGTILTLGYNTGFLALWLRLRQRANFINMDGIEWKRAKYALPARLYLWINERLAALSGASLIADHPHIERRLRAIAPRADVTMIPYGGEAPDIFDDAQGKATLATLGLEDRSYFTLIARPEAENSILEIVQAFSTEPSGAKLVVLGRYDPAIPYHARVLAAAGPDVLFPGAIYDSAVLHILRARCIAYLHGHQVGGTNPSLVEALAAGNPVIAHDNPFTRWVAGDAALYFSDVAGCRAALRELADHPARRDAMRTAAIARWDSHFRWAGILSDYERLLARVPSTMPADGVTSPDRPVEPTV